jgi:THAP domain
VAATASGKVVTMTSVGQRVRFPKDKERLKQWLQKIPQDLKADQITEYMGVCKRYFDPIFASLEYSATGSDETIRTWPRESPVLAHDAVPTTFPHTPFYLSSFIPLSACKLKAPDARRADASARDDAARGKWLDEDNRLHHHLTF